MIIILTIFIMWNIISLLLVIDSDSELIITKIDNIFTTISKLYWVSLIIIGFIIFCYLLSASIVCHSENSDYKICTKIRSDKK